MMKTLKLDLGERSYPMYIDNGLLLDRVLLARHIRGERVAIISNETVAPLYMESVSSALSEFDPLTIILADGEQYKNLQTMDRIYDALLKEKCDRTITLIALGGGVIGDMTGFAAATYMRGVDFIQIPTTLLAQVDSSVGGKTGVNHVRGKNMIGAFYQPRCVIIDTNTLNTLADKELSAGLAEIIKYGLIRDVEFLDWLKDNMSLLLSRENAALIEVVYRSCRHKAEVVAQDEREGGIRALLNLGHTFGHAIETGMGYGAWLHGEAVAVGMAMAAELSHRKGWISEEDVLFVDEILRQAKLPTRAPVALSTERMRELMSVDKKVSAGQLRLVLMRALGEAILTDDFSESELSATLEACRE
ncbi:MAG: 3-dehydroquinate synthase [Gammaproteobacteria bacterium]|nr:MAG: 3-dehydroquinate synthase [Gammaproteobacteria bacterium]